MPSIYTRAYCPFVRTHEATRTVFVSYGLNEDPFAPAASTDTKPWDLRYRFHNIRYVCIGIGMYIYLFEMFPVFEHARQIATYSISTNIHVLSLQIDITIFHKFSRYYSCYRCEKRVAFVLNVYDLVKGVKHMGAIYKQTVAV